MGTRFKRGTRPAKGVGMPTGYTRFGGGCTRLAAETLAGYYWLESFCKGLVVYYEAIPKEVW